MPDYHHPLTPFFAPRTVAVIGATEEPRSAGRTVLWNLVSSPFGGTVFPVNPQRPSVLGIKAYPTLADVPAKVDLAVITTPAPGVAQIVAQCAAAGVRGAIVVSAGAREGGALGPELELQIAAAAQQGRVRLIGPASFGVMNARTGLNASYARAPARPGNLAFVSQSGALCTAVLDWSLREHLGFSKFVAVGSMLDVGWGDLIDYLAEDGDTQSILLYMESIGDVRAFLSAARETALTKPIIVLRAGGGQDGRDDVLDAAFRRCGALRVTTIANMFALAEVLARQSRPRGPRLTILTNAGGPALLATDALLAAGGQLAELSAATSAALDAATPAWSQTNPVDILSDADAARYGHSFAALAADPNSDGTLVILAPTALSDPAGTAAQIVAAAKGRRSRPLLASWMGGAAVAEAQALLNAAGVPTFSHPDAAAYAFMTLWRYSDTLRLLYETPSLPDDATFGAPDRAAAEAILRRARRAGRLTAAAARRLLAAYGVASGRPPLDAAALLAGSLLDPQFGPVLRFGAGGAAGQAQHDLTLALPPLTSTLARRTLERTRAGQALSSPAAAAVEHLLLRLSQLVVEQRLVKGITIDPLWVNAAGVVVAGAATVLVHGPELADEELPTTAVRPYPTRYVQEWTARDDAPLLIRPIRPEDEPLLVPFHQTLSAESVYMRYMMPLKLDQRIAHERLTRICFIDYDREMALVAERRAADGQPYIMAIGRLTRLRGTNAAEFATLVSDAYQGLGLGTELLRRLVQIGRDERLERIEGSILLDNLAMQRVAQRVGFTVRRTLEGIAVAEIKL